MDSPNTFQPYPAAMLDLHLRQIRVVSLLPGEYVDRISCELNSVLLDDLPEYTALSYVWGDRIKLREISLNGSSFQITPNLEAALRRLRHSVEVRRLWIDMLCIDQSNVEERTHQVNLMRAIYSEAREAFLWLGDYTETVEDEPVSPSLSEEALENFSIQDGSLGTNVPGPNQVFSQTEAIRVLGLIGRIATGRHLDIILSDILPPSTVAELYALGKFMNLPWWYRIWTVQEAIVPRKITILMGWLHVSWTTMVAAADNLFKLLKEPGPSAIILQTFFDRVAKIDACRKAYQKGVFLSLPEILHEFRYRLSTDPRDKIFALLGLVTGNPAYGEVDVDYTLPTIDVYKRVFIILLQNTMDLDLLLRQEEFHRTMGVPTWMPDWSNKVDPTDTATCSYIRTCIYPLYYCSRSAARVGRWSELTSILSLKGLLFDEVATLLGSSTDMDESSYPDFDHLKSLFESPWNQSRSNGRGWDHHHAFWRLINMDIRSTGSPEEKHGYIPRRATINDFHECTKRFPPHGLDQLAVDFHQYYKFFISKKGYFGLGPRNMQIGDMVHIFLGGRMPFILRQSSEREIETTEETCYEYIGECYVQGIMDGEALEGVEESKVGWINLV